MIFFEWNVFSSVYIQDFTCMYICGLHNTWEYYMEYAIWNILLNNTKKWIRLEWNSGIIIVTTACSVGRQKSGKDLEIEVKFLLSVSLWPIESSGSGFIKMDSNQVDSVKLSGIVSWIGTKSTDNESINKLACYIGGF